MLLVLLFALFLIGSAVLVGQVFFTMLGSDVMPFTCPRCHDGGDEDLAGDHVPWYRTYRNGTVRCRACGTGFKEHPNGTLVEDRDP